MLSAGNARIDFNANFRIGSKRELLCGEAEEIFHLRRCQIGRRATAPMKLHDGTRTRDPLTGVLDLTFERSEIGRRDAVVFRDDHIASAKKAEAFAKRQVHVKRDWSASRFGLLISAIEIFEAEIVAPHRRGRITGVTRSGAVIKREKFGRNAKSLAFELEIQIGMLQVAHTKDTGFRISVIALGRDSGEKFPSAADCPARIKARAFSTGVSGRIP